MLLFSWKYHPGNLCNNFNGQRSKRSPRCISVFDNWNYWRDSICNWVGLIFIITGSLNLYDISIKLADIELYRPLLASLASYSWYSAKNSIIPFACLAT